MKNALPLPGESYIHPNIEKRWINLKLSYGLFTIQPIKAGGMVLHDSGVILSKDEYQVLPPPL